MKTLLILLLAFTPYVLFAQAVTLTKADRRAAVKYLKATQKDLKKTIKGLSQTQLDWTPGSNEWGVEDCVKHLAVSEGGLRQMLDGFMKAPANPNKRADLKMTDAQWIAGMESREKKIKTMTPLEPQNTPYKGVEDAMAAFENGRASLIDLIKSTDVDLRNHVGQFPMGLCDSYQLALLISAHTRRHTAQIKEVIANPNFPKS